MKVKYVRLTLVGVLVLALFLLLIWRCGLIGDDLAVSPDIREQVAQNGIYAELDITPQAGILVGDVLTVSMNIFFDRSRKEVSEELIAEDYIKFKKDEFTECEEYVNPRLTSQKIAGLTRISLVAEFQCFFTEAREKKVIFYVKYSDKLNSINGTVKLSREVSFASIPTDSPIGFQAHHYQSKNYGLWLICLGATLLGIPPIFLILRVYLNKKREKTFPEAPETCDYFLLRILKLKEAMSPEKTQFIVDRLYHILSAMEEKRGQTPDLSALKAQLRDIYHPEKSVTVEDAKSYLSRAEEIQKMEGEAK